MEKCIENCWGKSDFSVQEIDLLLQNYYLFTLFPTETVAMKEWKGKT